ncbi:hypothetical protein GZL_08522 [Streptomyces sp. 769]|nr:hypothetical protein GZL_08522 [Streptomyces sp. 769]
MPVSVMRVTFPRVPTAVGAGSGAGVTTVELVKHCHAGVS